jgi:CheY-like chemotaxis protein
MAASATVLIAEDDPNIRDLLHELLEGEGYESLVVSNGQEALDLALAQPIDVILLDLQMPVLNGEAFCTAYREHGGKAPGHRPGTVQQRSHCAKLPPFWASL